jgi:urease accessory protein
MRGAVRATTRLTVDGGIGRGRVRWAHEWPVVLRPTGPHRIHLVHAVGGPLGGDELGLIVEVGAEARLAVHSAGATLVQPGAGAAAGSAARWTMAARVGAGARLHWAPEPTVVSDGAALESTLRVELAPGACATVRDVVVLGRHGQRGGRYSGGLEVLVGGEPLLVHTTVLDGGDPALCGPAGTAGARAVGTLLWAGDGGASWSGAGESAEVRWAWTPLEGPGAVLVAVGAPSAVAAVLDGVGAAAVTSPAAGEPAEQVAGEVRAPATPPAVPARA